MDALKLPEAEEALFYDLAGKARSGGVSPDLPEYIMENEVVRFALRIARDKGSTDDWKQFIENIEKRR